MTTNFRRPSTNPARRTSSSISCVFKNAAAWYENGSITLEYIISDLVSILEMRSFSQWVDLEFTDNVRIGRKTLPPYKFRRTQEDDIDG